MAISPDKADFLVISQGFALDLSGQKFNVVLAEFLEESAKRARSADYLLKSWRPFWHVRENVSMAHGVEPPLGYEHYQIQPDGTLGPRVTNWDSSD